MVVSGQWQSRRLHLEHVRGPRSIHTQGRGIREKHEQAVAVLRVRRLLVIGLDNKYKYLGDGMLQVDLNLRGIGTKHRGNQDRGVHATRSKSPGPRQIALSLIIYSTKYTELQIPD